MLSSVIITNTTRRQLTNRLKKRTHIHRANYSCAVSNVIDTQQDANLKSWREIPGPSALPCIGQLLHYFPGGELSKFPGLDEIKKLFDRYGPMVRLNSVIGVDNIVLLGDPELTALILRSENRLPVRPGFVSLEYYRREYKKSKGVNVRTTGLVTETGDNWKKFRSIVNPVMLQPKTVKLYYDVMDEVAMDVIKRLKADRDENNRLKSQFSNEMNLWALESIGSVALGCRLNSLNSSLPEDTPQRQLIKSVHDFFEVSNELDFKPSIWRHITTPMFKRGMALYERIDNLTKHFINKSIEQLKQNTGHKPDHEKGVLEKLLEIDQEVAYVMAADMLFAGIDTASNNMTATLYLLSTNRDKQEKLREEILSKPKDQRPYLRACIKETMRLMPVVSANVRKTTKEYNLMGYKIPNGMNIMFAHREMSLMEQHYPRAREFIPERWIAKKGDPLYYGDTHPFVHSPFGFGVRSCIGRRFAELQIETFLTRIIENFDLNWIGPPPRIEYAAINYIKGPFHFIFNDLK